MKQVKNKHFSRHFGTLPWISKFYFLTDFDASKIVFGHFLRSLRKSNLKTCIAALNHEFYCLTFFTWWPEMTLTCIMVTKHRTWYLQMSVALSMPIHWLCLRLTSKLCSPMSPSPKSRTFRLWPDLWRHQWPLAQISHHVWKVHAQSYLMAFKFCKLVQWFGRSPPPPPTKCVTRQSPTGRGTTLYSNDKIIPSGSVSAKIVHLLTSHCLMTRHSRHLSWSRRCICIHHFSGKKTASLTPRILLYFISFI